MRIKNLRYWNKLSRFEQSYRLISVSCTASNSYKPPYNVLFFGTDGYAVACLRKLHEESLSVNSLEIVSLPKIGKSKSAVDLYAYRNNLPLHNWGKLPGLKAYDLGVVVSFGRMIPKKVIESFPLGMLNVHGSLLPAYRGAAPISRAIEAGDISTGVTVVKIEPHRFDIGNILALSDPITITDDVTSRELNTSLADVGADLLVETLTHLPNKLRGSTPQDGSTGSKAPKITLDDTYIDFNQLTSVQVWNKYRAYGFTKKFSLRCSLDGQMVRLKEFVKPDSNDMFPNDEPGLVRYHKKSKSLLISCKQGVIACTKLTLTGPITPLDFNNGQIQWRHKIGKKVIFEPLLNQRTQKKKQLSDCG